MTTSTPTEPQQLRAEIARTRAALGVTVQALAAKTDVKARAKQAAGDAAGRARQKLALARARAGYATATARDQLVTGLPVAGQWLTVWKEHVLETSRRPAVRRVARPAALAAAAALLAGGALVVAARKRS